MRQDPYLKILNRLYKEGLQRQVDITDYALKVARVNLNYPKRSKMDERNILLKRMQDSGHINFYFKDDAQGQRRILAEITQYGHDFIGQKKSEITSKLLGRAALIISTVSILVSAYFSYKSNDEATRITELEKKVSALKQVILSQNKIDSSHKTSH